MFDFGDGFGKHMITLRASLITTVSTFRRLLILPDRGEQGGQGERLFQRRYRPEGQADPKVRLGITAEPAS